MPRRRALTGEQLEELLALPATEPELIQHWTLGGTDLAAIERRRSDPNQFGFALQLFVELVGHRGVFCALEVGVGFANSDGLVFVDESTEQIASA